MPNNRPRERYIPEPTIVLMGCRAWDNVKRDVCPVCKGGVHQGDDNIHCARCDSSSPHIQKQIAMARAGMRTQASFDNSQRDAKADLDRLSKENPVLTESQRRRLWMGYSRSGIDSKNSDVVNRAKAGRDFLIAIGQEPDFSIELDAKGRPLKPAPETP